MESALHENGWNSCSSSVAPFSFVAKEAKITACPADDKGPGWISRIDGCQSVGYILHMQNFCMETFWRHYYSSLFLRSLFLLGL